MLLTPHEAAAGPPPGRAARGRLRIVVADDAVLLREGLARLLAEDGHQVVAAVGDGPALVLGALTAAGDSPRWGVVRAGAAIRPRRVPAVPAVPAVRAQAVSPSDRSH